jgi:hypothetical protein
VDGWMGKRLAHPLIHPSTPFSSFILHPSSLFFILYPF